MVSSGTNLAWPGADGGPGSPSGLKQVIPHTWFQGRARLRDPPTQPVRIRKFHPENRGQDHTRGGRPAHQAGTWPGLGSPAVCDSRPSPPPPTQEASYLSEPGFTRPCLPRRPRKSSLPTARCHPTGQGCSQNLSRDE